MAVLEQEPEARAAIQGVMDYISWSLEDVHDWCDCAIGDHWTRLEDLEASEAETVLTMLYRVEAQLEGGSD
jgi:hypothetical protein